MGVYTPPPATSGTTDHALLTHLDWPSSGHSGLTAAAAGAQPASTNLDLFAAITPSANVQSLLAAANYAAMNSLLGTLLKDGTVGMTGLLTLSGDPSTALHAATKQYVDNTAAGLDIKGSVLCATTANITLSGEQTIDGVSTSASRVLVKNQSTASQNGIYVSASGSWTRSTDMDAWTEVPGACCWVEQGTAQQDSAWVCTSNAGGTIGSTGIAFTQFGGTGAFQAVSVILNSLAGLSLVLGDTIYASSGSAFSRIAGNTTTTRKFWRQTGDGVNSAAPAWDTVTKTDVGLTNVENTALSTWAGSTALTTLGTVTAGTVPGVLLGVQVLTSGTSYTPTSGTKTIDVDAYAGGGGGGGTTTTAVQAAVGGGGAAGGRARKRYTGIGAGPYTYAIGSGGGGGNNSGSDGGGGGDTTFTDGTTLITAKGGGGGKGQAASATAAFTQGGSCPISTNGDINGSGQPGGWGDRKNGTLAASGMGGSSPWGSGGAPLIVGGAGVNALGFSAGGSGGNVTNGSAAVVGGNGTGGIIIIFEYA